MDYDKKLTKLTIDELLTKHLGEFGFYQKIQFLLLCIPNAVVAMQVFAWTFTGFAQPHRCVLRGEMDSSSFNLSWALTNYNRNTTSDFECRRPKINFTKDQSIRLVGDADVEWEGCNDGYKWDLSEVKSSAVSRWGLVCDKQTVQAVQLSCYFIGQFVGALSYGFLGDRFGRKVCFIFAIFIQLICGVASAYVPYWELYAILRLILGTCHPGILYICVVVCLEMVGPSRRMMSIVGTLVFWSVGQVILGCMAYAIRDYQNLQLAISLPGVLFIGYWWLIPESFRWLVSQQRFEEADKLLQSMAKWNKTKVPPNWQLAIEKEEKVQHNSAADTFRQFFEILKSPVLRLHLAVAWFSFLAVGLVYYGIAVNPSFEGGDRYSMFIYSAIIEIFGSIMVGVLVNITGRKLFVILVFAVAGISLLCTLFIPHGSVYLWAFYLKLGCIVVAKCAAIMAFSGVILYMPELFATGIRNTVTGTCSSMARIGSISASYLTVFLTPNHVVVLVLIFCVMALLASAALFLVPETTGQSLPETKEEAAQLATGHHCWTFKWNVPKNGSEKGKRNDSSAVTMSKV